MQGCLAQRLWLNPLIKLIHIIILAIAVAVSGKVRTYFSDLSVKNCGTASTNANLMDLSDQINNYVYMQNRNSLIVTCIMIFIDVLTLLYTCLCKKKEQTDKQAQGGNNGNAVTPQGP